jgi:hypothetical protein
MKLTDTMIGSSKHVSKLSGELSSKSTPEFIPESSTKHSSESSKRVGKGVGKPQADTAIGMIYGKTGGSKLYGEISVHDATPYKFNPPVFPLIIPIAVCIAI